MSEYEKVKDFSQKPLLSITIRNDKQQDQAHAPIACIDLPTTKDVVKTAFEKIGLLDPLDCRIANYESPIKGLRDTADYLKAFDETEIDALNYLCTQIKQMPERMLQTFELIAESKHTRDPIMLINAVATIDSYRVHPNISNMIELGKHIVHTEQRYGIPDPQKAHLIDYESIGLREMQQTGGDFVQMDGKAFFVHSTQDPYRTYDILSIPQADRVTPTKNELTNTNMLLVRPNQKPKEIEANSQETNNPVVFQNYRELESASVYQDMFPDVLVLMQTNQNDKTLVWNRTIKDPDGVIVDAIRGDMLICRMEKNGDLKGLSKEEMTFFKETFKHPELIMEIDSAILSIAVPALKNEKNQLEQKKPQKADPER